MNSINPAIPSELLAATQALAENLLASEPFVNYDRAHVQLKADSQANQLLTHLSNLQAELRQRQAQGQVTQEHINQLRTVQSNVQANHVIMDYMGTQQLAVAYLREINQEISQLLGADFAALAKRSSC
jgi:cell fate (sporulation/competence/biofilm development) regulator YlbF (YheA/YmcA/DUF963 family)